ncbi:hypothetical protein ES332_D04G227300v1 [Gossypium tomentosum]|uniref:Uncharacterized protein n=1 Tax=Gossypium tomentosum TaxID=34277 RepID=A0A5D2LGZ8_GOSTO|nr:hypothetical protein ES332_D04G227300v1 [Gossypium tomentosum]
MIKRETRSDFMEQILSKCPSLLLQTNAKGQTPSHLAASNCGFGRRCYRYITAAISVTDRYLNPWYCGIVEVVKALLEFEDPDFPSSANKKQETPLYIAAMAGDAGRNRSRKKEPRKPEQNITHMEASLYNAAAEGNIEVFNNKQGLQLESLKTPNQDNVLHVNLATEETVKFSIIKIFSVGFVPAYPFLNLFVTMIKREKNQILSNKFSASVRHCYSKRMLKSCAKAIDGDLELGMDQVSAVREMLRITDQESNTALHEAAGCGNVEVVKALLEFEVPDFPYSANKKQETPLYIAAKRGDGGVLSVILDKSKSAAHGGPHGRTALHAAAMAGDAEAIRIILEKKGNLTKERDEDGHTPLHYAAHLGSRLSVVEELLKRDVSAAYIGDKKRGMTPLLMAAREGNGGTRAKILSLCPDCCEKVDNKGLNLLHYTAFKDCLPIREFCF